MSENEKLIEQARAWLEKTRTSGDFRTNDYLLVCCLADALEAAAREAERWRENARGLEEVDAMRHEGLARAVERVAALEKELREITVLAYASPPSRIVAIAERALAAGKD